MLNEWEDPIGVEGLGRSSLVLLMGTVVMLPML